MTPEERDEFVDNLERWKREGCSVLVVGEALDLLRQTSERLLGEDDLERYRIFALTDAEVDSVYERVRTDAPSALARQTRILDYESIPRSATTDVGAGTNRIPEVPVYGGLERLYDELTETMAEFESRSEGLPSGALRVSVDTLRPLLKRYDRDAVCRWMRHVDSATKSHHGIGHYLLPKPYASETVRRLRESVEIVIEVGPYDDEEAARKERWHVPDEGLTTPWRVVDDETRGVM